jgi:RNA polymerase sigma factor (sigma-70 family)
MALLLHDPDLLRRFRAGDRAALEEVYWAYVGQVESLIRRALSRGTVSGRPTTGPGDASDLVQEVFVKVFSRQARAAYDGVRPFGAYLLTVARNVLIDWGRRCGRELATDADLLERAVEGWGPVDEPWTDPRTLELVRRFLGGLSPELRAVHERRFVQGLSQRDAASALGIGRQALRTLEGRLRDGLREALEEQDGAVAQPALRRSTEIRRTPLALAGQCGGFPRGSE